MKTLKAKRATINIAGIEVEVFQLPNSEYAMSQSQVAMAVDKNEITFRRFLASDKSKLLPSKGFTFDALQIELGRPIKVIPINIAMAFWVTQASTGNAKAQALVYALALESLERRCDKAFNLHKTDEQYENNTIVNRETWIESRAFLKDAHMALINCCMAWGFNGAVAHDEISLAVCGMTAKELRELEVIEGNPKIGLNHVANNDELVRIAKVKLAFARYRTGTVKQRVKRAVAEVG